MVANLVRVLFPDADEGYFDLPEVGKILMEQGDVISKSMGRKVLGKLNQRRRDWFQPILKHRKGIKWRFAFVMSGSKIANVFPGLDRAAKIHRFAAL